MHTDHSTSHTSPGFGKNTNGLGIFIVAGIFVLVSLFTWWLWNNNNKFYKHYRIENAATAHHHGEHAEKNPKVEAATAVVGKLDSLSGNFIYELGDEITLTLPDGHTLKVGENSTEAKLFNFLSNSTLIVDTDKTKGWITCDRIYFETGSSTLTTASKQQIENLGTILKAFPDAEIKVGGYTDNTGNADVNTKVSQERAAIVANNLTPLIARGEIPSEGYGSEHPISTNDTDDGRALNRRVDIRVTKK